MAVAFFDTHTFEKVAFNEVNKQYKFKLNYLNTHLDSQTAALAKGSTVVCSFVNDKVDEACLRILSELGVKLIALRSAGFNHVDILAAEKYNIMISRVPSYSPHAVAEFATGLVLTLNRKIHKSYMRVKEQNFSLDGLVGFDLYGKTVGVIGTGRIGNLFAKIMAAYGCNILAYDLEENRLLLNHPKITYTNLANLCRNSDIISLHVPLTPYTFHLIGKEMIKYMKSGVLIVNTGRGALIDSKALIEGLKSEKIGGAALDVYEEEEDIFFKDLSDKVIKDDVLARLMTFPNVVITSHQGFLTREALMNIAITTFESIHDYLCNGRLDPECKVDSKFHSAS